MRWFKLIAVAVLVWGNSALADLAVVGDDLQQQPTIKSWLAQIQRAYPEIQVRLHPEPHDAQVVNHTIQDLQSLFNFMRGQELVPQEGLKTVQCKAAVCFHDGGEE